MSNFQSILVLKIVGVSFENRQQLIQKVSQTTELKLVREKNNQYDENAIGVFAKIQRFNKVAGWDGKWSQIGYVSAEIAKKLAPLVDHNRVDMDDVSVLNILKHPKKGSNIGIEICINNIDVEDIDEYMNRINNI